MKVCNKNNDDSHSNKVNKRNIVDLSMFSIETWPSLDNMIVDMFQPNNFKEEAIVEELQVLLQQESTRYLNNFDYLSTSRSNLPYITQPGSQFDSLKQSHTTTKKDDDCTNNQVNETWRKNICQWAFELVDHYGFDREVIWIALNFVDRVVAFEIQKENISLSLTPEAKDRKTQQNLCRRGFQLIAVTCLYIAIKLHGEIDSFDRPRCKLRIGTFAKLSRGIFTVKNIEEKELEILKILEWHVNPPSTLRFVVTLLQLLPEWSLNGKIPVYSTIGNALYEISRYFSELAVFVSRFSLSHKTSEVAYACILCAFDILQKKYSLRILHMVETKFIESVSTQTNSNLQPKDVTLIQKSLMELCPAKTFAKGENDDEEIKNSE